MRACREGRRLVLGAALPLDARDLKEDVNTLNFPFFSDRPYLSDHVSLPGEGGLVLAEPGELVSDLLVVGEALVLPLEADFQT